MSTEPSELAPSPQMPPQFALALCSVFVFFLLALERRNSAGVSPALWIPTLWLLAISSKPLGIWFGVMGDNESGSVLDRMLLAGLGLGAVFVLAYRKFDWSGALRPHAWLLSLVAYMLVSTLWSESTTIAVRRWARDAIVLVMALVIMSEAKPRQALENLLRRSAYILIPFSILLIKYYPALGIEYGRWSGGRMWVGVTLHKNSLGRVALLSAFFLLWALYRHWRERAAGSGSQRWADGLVLILALFLLQGSDDAYSATSIGTFVLGIVSLLGFLWVRNAKLAVPRAILLLLVVSLIGFGVSAPFLNGSNLSGFSTSFGRDETLTGRTETWAKLVPIVKAQPVLGCGFGSFWTTARRQHYEMSFAHNGYLDILLELGAVGLAVYTAWLLSCVRKLHAVLASEYEWAILAICFLLMMLVYNATESALNTLSVEMTTMVAVASMVVPYGAVRVSPRSHLRLRLHVSPQRVSGTAAPESAAPENRRPVRVLGRGGGQRYQRTRTGDGRTHSGRRGR